MAYGYNGRTQAVTGINWMYTLQIVGGALIGGIIGFMASWAGAIAGIVGLIAIQFIKQVPENIKTFGLFLFASMFVGGLIGMFAGFGQAFSAAEMAASDSIALKVLSVPTTFNEFLFGAIPGVNATPQAMYLQDKVDVQVASQVAALSTGTTGTNGSWEF